MFRIGQIFSQIGNDPRLFEICPPKMPDATHSLVKHYFVLTKVYWLLFFEITERDVAGDDVIIFLRLIVLYVRSSVEKIL